jgi:uncharacterized membrane protein
MLETVLSRFEVASDTQMHFPEVDCQLAAATARITDPTTLLVFFSVFVGLVFLLARTKPFDRIFAYIPPIVWVYLLPAVGTSCGLTPSSSPLYDWCSNILMPAALLLLILATDLKAIARLGPPAIMMVLAGTFGIVVGGPLALGLFHSHLDPQAWKGLAALAGSWIGGLENMMAIKEGVGCPQEMFSPVIVVDSVVGYGWMSVLIALSVYQNRIDRWNKANRNVLDELNARLADYQTRESRPITLGSFSLMLAFGFGGGWCSMRVGESLPEVGAVMSHYTWGIVIVVALGLLLSFTPARRLENEGASTVAYGGLYLLVATMGATGDLRGVLEVPVLFVLGMVWIGVHIACLALAARLIRAPMFLFATGSMSNVGGVISTPIVATVYQRALAPVGILMGVLGNVIGTPAGLLCAELMSAVAQAHYGEAALGTK